MGTLKEARDEAVKAAIDAQNTMNSAGANVTDEQIKAVQDAVAEVKEIDARIAGSKAALDALASIAPQEDDYAPGDDTGMQKAATLGERFIKSSTYAEWARRHPSGVGEGTNVALDGVKIGDLSDFLANRKAAGNLLTSTLAQIKPTRYPTVDMVDRRPLTLLDVIGKGRMGGPFEYVQITGVTNNAAIVAEATSETQGLKPTSDMTTTLADCKPYTFADGFTVTNQLLSDGQAFASYMQTSLSYNLDTVIEEKILNGTGTGEPRGILKTTGVQEITVSGTTTMDLIKAIRRAKGKVQRVGGVSTAVMLNPEDAEEIDLLQDQQGRFYGQGPFGIGPNTLWGVPVITSEKITKGQALTGDFKQVQLLDREGLSVVAFNQHKDYAQRNLVYVRAELRSGLVIWRPNRLALVKQA